MQTPMRQSCGMSSPSSSATSRIDEPSGTSNITVLSSGSRSCTVLEAHALTFLWSVRLGCAPKEGGVRAVRPAGHASCPDTLGAWQICSTDSDMMWHRRTGMTAETRQKNNDVLMQPFPSVAWLAVGRAGHRPYLTLARVLMGRWTPVTGTTFSEITLLYSEEFTGNGGRSSVHLSYVRLVLSCSIPAWHHAHHTRWPGAIRTPAPTRHGRIKITTRSGKLIDVIRKESP